MDKLRQLRYIMKLPSIHEIASFISITVNGKHDLVILNSCQPSLIYDAFRPELKVLQKYFIIVNKLLLQIIIDKIHSHRKVTQLEKSHVKVSIFFGEYRAISYHILVSL